MMAYETYITVLLCLVAYVTPINYERAIQDKILTDYSNNVRPQPESGGPLKVSFGVRMQKFVRLDVRSQTLTIKVFILFKWFDSDLAWNISHYNGTSYISVDRLHIWTPDVTLYNTAEEQSIGHHDMYKTKPTIMYNGLVIWNSPVTLKISCNFDVTWFPVDAQKCNISFGSYSYGKSRLELIFYSKPKSKANFFSEHFLVKSGEWEINKLVPHKETVKFDCCPITYSVITYEMIVTRMSLYYFMYIIMPLISLSFLFGLVFKIPYDSGERMGFGVTILLSITVYLLVISEKLPEKSDNVPMLGICFIAIFYSLCLALGMATIPTVLARGTSKPPDCLIKWVNGSRSSKNKVRKKKNKEQQGCSSLPPVECTGENAESNRDCDQGKEMPTVCNEEDDYHDLRRDISQFIDGKCFILFNVLIILFPLIIILVLPKSGLG